MPKRDRVGKYIYIYTDVLRLRVGMANRRVSVDKLESRVFLTRRCGVAEMQER